MMTQFCPQNDFPEIKNYIGKTLITTDGTTLLGGDDLKLVLLR